MYAPKINAKDVEVDWSYEDLQHLLELTPKKVSLGDVWQKPTQFCKANTLQLKVNKFI